MATGSMAVVRGLTGQATVNSHCVQRAEVGAGIVVDCRCEGTGANRSRSGCARLEAEPVSGFAEHLDRLRRADVHSQADFRDQHPGQRAGWKTLVGDDECWRALAASVDCQWTTWATRQAATTLFSRCPPEPEAATHHRRSQRPHRPARTPSPRAATRLADRGREGAGSPV